jgi:hypothetical protein
MHDLTAKRTLVKSPPELWSELSEVDRLARHLDAFGEIKITKLEPEHTVAWEGEAASGTVSIEPSGWGTKVTLTAQLEGEAPPDEPPAGEVVVVEPEAVVEEPVAEVGTVEEPAHELAEEPVDESVSSEPEAAEPAERAEPVETPPRGRRRLLGWLFRPRTSVQETEAKPDASVPEPLEASEPEPELPVAAAEPELEPVATSEPEPVATSEPEPVAASEPEPVAVIEAEPVSEPDASDASEGQVTLDLEHAQAVLDEVLDTLGSAHHRPFSRG